MDIASSSWLVSQSAKSQIQNFLCVFLCVLCVFAVQTAFNRYSFHIRHIIVNFMAIARFAKHSIVDGTGAKKSGRRNASLIANNQSLKTDD
jgi:hypothetical protein